MNWRDLLKLVILSLYAWRTFCHLYCIEFLKRQHSICHFAFEIFDILWCWLSLVLFVCLDCMLQSVWLHVHRCINCVIIVHWLLEPLANKTIAFEFPHKSSCYYCKFFCFLLLQICLQCTYYDLLCLYMFGLYVITQAMHLMSMCF